MKIKEIPFHKGFYATEDGNIIGKKGKPLSLYKAPFGRYTVGISIKGICKTYLVHRLILRTFKPIRNHKKMTVDHIDNNPLNNNLSNLRWMTRGENNSRVFYNIKHRTCERHPNSSLTDKEAFIIYKLHKFYKKNKKRPFIPLIMKRFPHASKAVIIHIAKGRSWNHITGEPIKTKYIYKPNNNRNRISKLTALNKAKKEGGK